MAVVVTFDIPGRAALTGGLHRTGTLNFGTYATGGLALTAAQLGMHGHLDFLYVSPTNGYTVNYSKTAETIKAYEAADVEVANGSTDLASLEFPFLAQGY